MRDRHAPPLAGTHFVREIASVHMTVISLVLDASLPL